jgi:hypothetical protein
MLREDSKPIPVESADHVIPRGDNFIRDFVFYTKGSETASLYALMSAFWGLSTAARREFGLVWGDELLYPNLYVILVGAPNLGHKGHAMSRIKKVMKGLAPLFMKQGNYREAFMQDRSILSSKATSESLGILMANEHRTFFYAGDDPENPIEIIASSGSQLPMCVDELTTFLSQANYNAPLVDKLTDLYDNKDDDMDLTRSRGAEKYRDIYATFLSGTTPTHINTALPEQAKGGGFMSRVIFAHTDNYVKCFRSPGLAAGAPSSDELTERLAWCVQNAKYNYHEDGSFSVGGKYDFNNAASNYMDEWYKEWHKNTVAKMYEQNMTNNRAYLHVCKLACLIRAAEYRPGRDITVANVEDAISLVNYLASTSNSIFDEVGANEYNIARSKVVKYLVRKGSATRSVLLRNLFRYLDSDSLTRILAQLVQEGRIIINDNPRCPHPTLTGSEKYTPTNIAIAEIAGRIDSEIEDEEPEEADAS